MANLPLAPEFRVRAPWWGADLQTLRNAIRRPQPDLASHRTERLTLPLGDGTGDALSVLLQQPIEAEGRPAVVLVHGLSGSEESAYMTVSAAWWLSRGHPVLRFNLRGAGSSRPLCRFQYHAGRSDDLHAALGGLPAALTESGLFLVGYSLGGNVVLKFLAEYGGVHPIRGAASVSAPIDLAAASQRFLAPRNTLYQWHLLRGMKSESLAPGAEISDDEARLVRGSRSIFEFDDVFVAPRNGFSGAVDYYARSSALGFLSEIRLPTALIHSLDDPWVPSDSYREHRWSESPALEPLLVPAGGHVGFHVRGGRVPWHDRALAAFFASL